MNHNTTFSYRYSAQENEEILAIRNKYLPQSESKLDELKRLDKEVQKSGVVEGLTVGIVGLLIFGLGMSFSMQVLGNGIMFIILGVLIAVVGAGVMVAAYMVYRRIYRKTREKYTLRILELAEELAGESTPTIIE